MAANAEGPFASDDEAWEALEWRQGEIALVELRRQMAGQLREAEGEQEEAAQERAALRAALQVSCASPASLSLCMVEAQVAVMSAAPMLHTRLVRGPLDIANRWPQILAGRAEPRMG